MPEKAKSARPAMTGTGIPFEPKYFNDPVAVQTEWTPLVYGGSNICTRKLKSSSQGMAFKPTLSLLSIALSCIVIGAVTWLLCGLSILSSQSLTQGTLMALFIGLMFGGGGAWIWYTYTTPIVFDAARGFFWKGRLGRDGAVDQLDVYVPLKQIRALQLISESCTMTETDSDGDRSTRHYHSFELNLVDHRGQRLNVVDHGNYQVLRADADTLAAFLDVPVWDACG